MNIKEMFLNYFQNKQHNLIKSSSLIPNDKTLLFTNSGMVQFKDIFIGEREIPKNPRVTSSQLCIRAGGKHNDLDNVGYTGRHHTFFIMLGNFSFGDYFKDKAIEYAWEFITNKKYLNLPIEKLWITVHKKDIDSYNIWKNIISKDKIIKLGDSDNFWSMGDTGACGYCSEIFYDQGESNFNSSNDYLGGDGDRFLEIWNLVFMEFEKNINGKLIKLAKPSIDTGMGLERVTAIKEGKNNNYHSSLFMPLIKKLEEILDIQYKNQASFKIIVDHLRSCSFLLSEGVKFDKDGRGYVLRRIMRRAIRYGYQLGKKEPFIFKLVDTLIKIMGDDFNKLKEKKELIKNLIKKEEENFLKTIQNGIVLFNEELKKNNKNIFDGKIAFKLYDTYGFPLDLTQDMLREKNIKIDLNKFNECMKIQKESSKHSSKMKNSLDFNNLKKFIEKNEINIFIGYKHLSSRCKVIALFNENFQTIKNLNGTGWVVFNFTPFYPESGGQVGDIGVVKDRGEILDTQKYLNINLSKFKGNLSLNSEVEIFVNSSRYEISKHHSATHLLNLALRKIIEKNIVQKGSLVQKNRLRFDFAYEKPLTKEEIEKIENFVNKIIYKNVSKKTNLYSLEKAKKSGAIGIFNDKYGDKVRVVEMGDSKELCGGTHIKNSSEIGIFIILKESGVSSGIRRIEAICGEEAIKYIFNLKNELLNIQKEIKSSDPIVAIRKLKDNIKELKNELKVKNKNINLDLKEKIINDVKIIIDEVETGDIKTIIDNFKNKHKKIAIMIFQKKRANILIACGTKKINIKSGDWIKNIAHILGGKGGGKDNFAQAGGKDILELENAKQEAFLYLEKNLL